MLREHLISFDCVARINRCSISESLERRPRLVLEIATYLQRPIPRPQVHYLLVSRALMNLRRRALAHLVILHGLHDPLQIISLIPNAFIRSQPWVMTRHFDLCHGGNPHTLI